MPDEEYIISAATCVYVALRGAHNLPCRDWSWGLGVNKLRNPKIFPTIVSDRWNHYIFLAYNLVRDSRTASRIVKTWCVTHHAG